MALLFLEAPPVWSELIFLPGPSESYAPKKGMLQPFLMGFRNKFSPLKRNFTTISCQNSAESNPARLV
jgi:hypothetical protein